MTTFAERCSSHPWSAPDGPALKASGFRRGARIRAIKRVVFVGEVFLVLFILATTRFIADTPREGAKPRLDGVGTFLSAAGLGAIVLGILHMHSGSPEVIAAFRREIIAWRMFLAHHEV